MMRIGNQQKYTFREKAHIVCYRGSYMHESDGLRNILQVPFKDGDHLGVGPNQPLVVGNEHFRECVSLGLLGPLNPLGKGDIFLP